MVLTRRQSAELRSETQKAEMSGTDPHEQLQVINGVQYAAPTSFDDILPEYYRRIATIPWFSRRSVPADAESGFEVLEHYAWDAGFFGGCQS